MKNTEDIRFMILKSSAIVSRGSERYLIPSSDNRYEQIVKLSEAKGNEEEIFRVASFNNLSEIGVTVNTMSGKVTYRNEEISDDIVKGVWGVLTKDKHAAVSFSTYFENKKRRGWKFFPVETTALKYGVIPFKNDGFFFITGATSSQLREQNKDGLGAKYCGTGLFVSSSSLADGGKEIFVPKQNGDNFFILSLSDIYPLAAALLTTKLEVTGSAANFNQDLKASSLFSEGIGSDCLNILKINLKTLGTDLPKALVTLIQEELFFSTVTSEERNVKRGSSIVAAALLTGIVKQDNLINLIRSMKDIWANVALDLNNSSLGRYRAFLARFREAKLLKIITSSPSGLHDVIAAAEACFDCPDGSSIFEASNAQELVTESVRIKKLAGVVKTEMDQTIFFPFLSYVDNHEFNRGKDVFKFSLPKSNHDLLVYSEIMGNCIGTSSSYFASACKGDIVLLAVYRNGGLLFNIELTKELSVRQFERIKKTALDPVDKKFIMDEFFVRKSGYMDMMEKKARLKSKKKKKVKKAEVLLVEPRHTDAG